MHRQEPYKSNQLFSKMLQIDSEHAGKDFIAISGIDALLLSREVEKNVDFPEN